MEALCLGLLLSKKYLFGKMLVVASRTLNPDAIA